MARKLKTYVTSLGFFDQAIAAPSMKAALQAWGAESNLFHQGAARESDDPAVIAATMEKPGVLLKRPVGSSGAYKEHAELPKDVGDDGGRRNAARQHKPPKAAKRPAGDKAADRKAALAYEREQKQRERDRAREEAAQEKKRRRRQEAVDKAKRALDAARGRHEGAVSDLQRQIEAVETKVEGENVRWSKEKQKLEAALQRAKG